MAGVCLMHLLDTSTCTEADVRVDTTLHLAVVVAVCLCERRRKILQYLKIKTVQQQGGVGGCQQQPPSSPSSPPQLDDGGFDVRAAAFKRVPGLVGPPVGAAGFRQRKRIKPMFIEPGAAARGSVWFRVKTALVL